MYIYIYTLYITATRRIHMETMLGARNTHAVNWNECLVNVWDFRRDKGGSRAVVVSHRIFR